jgi:acyl carrier protein
MSTREGITEKIYAIIASHSPVPEINDSMSLLDDLRIDSLSYISIVTKIEDEFDFQFPEDDLTINEQFTISDFISMVENLLTHRI